MIQSKLFLLHSCKLITTELICIFKDILRLKKLQACKPMAVSFQCMTKFTTNLKKKRSYKQCVQDFMKFILKASV